MHSQVDKKILNFHFNFYICHPLQITSTVMKGTSKLLDFKLGTTLKLSQKACLTNLTNRHNSIYQTFFKMSDT